MTVTGKKSWKESISLQTFDIFDKSDKKGDKIENNRCKEYDLYLTDYKHQIHKI